MKIEWLNPEATEAVVTRGWIRKRRALVKRGERWISIGSSARYREACWVFAATGNYVGWWTNTLLDNGYQSERNRRFREHRKLEWVPLDSLPTARIIEKENQ